MTTFKKLLNDKLYVLYVEILHLHDNHTELLDYLHFHDYLQNFAF